MKRFTKTLVAAILVVATGAVIMVGCKKEENAQMKDGVAQTEQNMSPSEQKIIDFMDAYSSMKQGAKVEGDAVSPEDARWYWESVLNYRHSFTQSYLVDMRRDTVRLTMPKTNAEGNISYADLLTTYGDIVDAVREAYVSIDMDDKTLQFVSMSIKGNVSKDDDAEVVVLVNTGRNNGGNNNSSYNNDVWYGRPFVAGDNWICGFNQGSCDGTILNSDAPKQITTQGSIYDMRHSREYNPCPDCYTYILNPRIVDSIFGTPYTDSIFYAEHLTLDEAMSYCIGWNDMNKYYGKMMTFSHYPGMVINPYNVDWYYRVETLEILQGEGGEFYRVLHRINKWNCIREWRHHGLTPVPIDDPQI